MASRDSGSPPRHQLSPEDVDDIVQIFLRHSLNHDYPGHVPLGPAERAYRDWPQPRPHLGTARDAGRHAQDLTLGVRGPEVQPLKARRAVLKLALQHVHNQVKEAQEFYNAVLSEFDVEVEQIKTFADKKTLDSVWRKKIEAKGKASANNTTNFDTLVDTLPFSLDQLKKADRRGTVSQQQNDDVTDRIDHIVRRTVEACEEIVRLAKRAKHDQSACTTLVSDLKEAMDMTDMTSDANKALFSTREAGTEGGSEGNGTQEASI